MHPSATVNMRLKMRLTALSRKMDFTLSDLELGFGLGLANIYIGKHELHDDL